MRPEGEGPVSPVDLIIVAVIGILLFASVRSLVRSNKNGCSDCGGNCSAHGAGSCSAAKKMLADADAALARNGSCCKH